MSPHDPTGAGRTLNAPDVRIDGRAVAADGTFRVRADRARGEEGLSITLARVRRRSYGVAFRAAVLAPAPEHGLHLRPAGSGRTPRCAPGAAGGRVRPDGRHAVAHCSPQRASNGSRRTIASYQRSLCRA